jgi:hypothetical protein
MTLRIAGTTSGYVEVDCAATGGNNTIVLPSTNGSTNQLLKNGSTAGTLGWSSMVEDSSGRIGIGSTGPQAALNIKKDANSTNPGDSASIVLTNKNTTLNGNIAGGIFADCYRDVNDPAYTGGIWFTRNSEVGNLSSSSHIIFGTTTAGASSLPTERMRIRSGTTGGLILVGRSSSVSANATLGIDTASGVAGIVSETGPTSAIDHIRFYNGNGNVGNITTNGSATAYGTSSDYRLKENITAIADGITRLQQLKPSRFNFIADPDTTVDGFIAHEAQVAVPECVIGKKDAVDEDGNPVYQGIDQSKLVPLLTAALQEAIAKIETLEAANAALDARLTALEAQS